MLFKKSTLGPLRQFENCIVESGSVKARAFASASMILSANLRMGPNKKANYEPSLDTRRDAARPLTRE
jgi:hypothetical protein